MTAFQPGGPRRFDHQRRGLAKLIQTGGVCALLFDPGLGKTATLLDYASLLALKNPGRETRVLVIAPLAAVDTWVKQAEIFVSPQVNFWAEALGGSLLERAEALASRGGQPFHPRFRPARTPVAPRGAYAPARAHHTHRALISAQRPTSRFLQGPDGVPADRPRLVIEILNIDALASRQPVTRSRTYADVMLAGIQRFGPDLVVVDESHRIKSAGGNASRLVARLTPYVRRRVLLTGTVMPHGPLDVFGQWRFLEPMAFALPDKHGVLKPATDGQFKNRFARLGGFHNKEILGYQNLDEMRAIMSRNAIVARKADALDLPRTTEVEVPVRLGPEEQRAYDDMKTMLAARVADGTLTVGSRLTQLMRLRQITSGFLHDTDTGRTYRLGHAKTETVRSIVYDNLAGERRIVVFALFTGEIADLARALQPGRDDPPTAVRVIGGGTPDRQRVAIRQWFGSSDPTRIVLVAQIRTMSLAVNELVTANHAIFASLSQQRDDLVQARDRLDRIGQTKPVTYWYALAPDTVDQVILRSHRDRTDLENSMLRHIGIPTPEREQTA